MRKKKSKKQSSSKFVPLFIFMFVVSLSFIVSAQNCCAASDGDRDRDRERERLIPNGNGNHAHVLVNVGEEDLEMGRPQQAVALVSVDIPENLLTPPNSDQAMQAMDAINICLEYYQWAAALAEAKTDDDQEYISECEGGINTLFEKAKTKELLNDNDKSNMAEILLDKARAAGKTTGELQRYFITARDKITHLTAKIQEYQRQEQLAQRIIAAQKKEVLKLQNSIWKRNLALWISIPSLLAAGVGAVLLTHYYWR